MRLRLIKEKNIRLQNQKTTQKNKFNFYERAVTTVTAFSFYTAYNIVDLKNKLYKNSILM